MKFYQVYDLQLADLFFDGVTREEIISYAADVMKDRAEACDDELSAKFKQVLKEGVTWEYALKVLTDYGYEIREI